MRKRTAAERGELPPAELGSIHVWCENRGLTGHLDGEAWNDGTASAWLAAREKWADVNGWDDERYLAHEHLRSIPNAPFHPELL